MVPFSQGTPRVPWVGPFLIYSKARALAWGLEKSGICLLKKDHPRVSRHCKHAKHAREHNKPSTIPFQPSRGVVHIRAARPAMNDSRGACDVWSAIVLPIILPHSLSALYSVHEKPST